MLFLHQSHTQSLSVAVIATDTFFFLMDQKGAQTVNVHCFRRWAGESLAACSVNEQGFCFEPGIGWRLVFSSNSSLLLRTSAVNLCI